MKKELQIRLNLIKSIYIYNLGIENNLVLTDEEKEIFLLFLSKVNEIDETISKALIGYSLDRLSKLDKAIVEYSVFEMQELKTPVPVAINEAVEITKLFSDLDDEKQHKFTNKLLQNIVANLKWAEQRFKIIIQIKTLLK